MEQVKQTAVEWLIEELNQKIDFIPMDKWDMIRDIVQQAKEMEKEQIIDACNYGDFEELGEQYYNETYGGNK
jgi:hypothetical protein